MFNWLHTYHPQPILFEIGWFRVHWYGLIMVIAILVGLWLVNRLAQQQEFAKAQWDKLVFYVLLSGLLGARLYHVFLEWTYYQEHLLDIFKVWQGGLAIHGAIIFGAAIVYLFCRRQQWSLFLVLDIMSLGIILGQAIGRWGNYFNQEIFGQPTDLPWGIFINEINRPLELMQTVYYHPTFLYESLLNLILFIILYFSFNRLIRWPGLVFSGYLVGYSIIRFSLEFLRIDHTLVVVGMRWPQIFSIFVIFLVIFAWLLRLVLPKLKKDV
ncbi:MAG: prolipoprotein diacylglyceryl transferase [Parcubacteria group bacterium CG1_02_37_51]|uniref:Phosphatidylglycerol--prolipoprotein diacylglyceryl transferase n=2 Tax=Candidatus Komeiliibacteriota TaxID=1817908 RepID=A0A2M8DQW4_9BACT|nr:MAG: prolipoprotein diacylglyceryl transferase [Parcubacteria group bacterium CG1_02_37_51]PIY95181.1 MAG: prolipoprotein diacylglyceryl transferase [Candidatus Komeilibacteria bacterium CG_4_10_14_0_8_um_filter_37_78]PJC01667.1 MAG: prolipoprotein diacylglyceryl transferase [Candidatus Komeilibacteria bacterium CG_4_9_14_0_8_um_filter_36_9]